MAKYINIKYKFNTYKIQRIKVNNNNKQINYKENIYLKNIFFFEFNRTFKQTTDKNKYKL